MTMMGEFLNNFLLFRWNETGEAKTDKDGQKNNKELKKCQNLLKFTYEKSYKTNLIQDGYDLTWKLTKNIKKKRNELD